MNAAVSRQRSRHFDRRPVRGAAAARVCQGATTHAALVRPVFRRPHGLERIADRRSVRDAGRQFLHVPPARRRGIDARDALWPHLRERAVMKEGFLLGIIVTASLVAAAYFLKFWRQTRDP